MEMPLNVLYLLPVNNSLVKYKYDSNNNQYHPKNSCDLFLACFQLLQ